MGTYLSTPITDKCEESGDSLDCPDVPCAWGVVDMQGWRKSMEDGHVGATDIPLPRGLEEPSPTESETRSDCKVFGVFDGHGGTEVSRFCGLYLISTLTQQPTWQRGGLIEPPPNGFLDGAAASETKVGKALRAGFHALDRMIDDVARREELITLRTVKPQKGERRDAISIPEPKPVEGTPPAVNGIAMDSQEGTGTAENTPDSSGSSEPQNAPETASNGVGVPSSGDVPTPQANEEREKGGEDGKADDDSMEAVGKEEAAERDRDMMYEEGSGSDEKQDAMADVVAPEQTNVATSMFQKILSLGAQGGQGVVNMGGSEDSEKKEETQPTPTPDSLLPGPSVHQPSIEHNGRWICNLPAHPIHAGATAIVAVVTGKVLTVANAGDSRAVLCRAGGATFPLSFDHKPHDNRELDRIVKAGGFVNDFGRVNGNLNLSRSIGDLKYKQVPGIDPAGQMITAEPDIVQVSLKPDDEFIILGCDGIWDCLSNENAVQYVKDRIDTKSPTEIGTEMLDDIISQDPRVTQGIGGDNMTIMIIDLQPRSRSGHLGPEASPTTAESPAN